ncbi:hypothetical protein KHQ81_13480 [Mycoplasmatota bacterium]|nr:hypothetical protein KHQ81_13480 [Mycoplasmatota bacterium]
MHFNNILIFQGNYSDIKSIREELNTFLKNKKSSKYYHDKTTKYIKKMKIVEEIERNYLYELKVTFLYNKTNLEALVQAFETPNIEIAHMFWNKKMKIWIVNQKEYIEKYQLIPTFAINQILLDYMDYKESSIILDSFQTIKYDRNDKQVVVNDKKLNHEELIDLLFNQTLNRKNLFTILEEFINNYYEKCINHYKKIYSINKEKIDSEEPSPLALFIVTFGIIGIIIVLIKVMGYF